MRRGALLPIRIFLLASLLCSTAGITIAAQRPQLVVLVQYLVSANSPEHVEKMLTSPIERTLLTLPRVAEIQTVTGHEGNNVEVKVEIHFEGGATEQDLAVVMNRIAQPEFSSDVQARSISIHLRPPRLQQ